MEEYIAKLAGFYLHSKLTGGDAPWISPSSLEEDGRKAGKVIKDLLAHEYIAVRDDGRNYSATSKAYDEVVAIKPDLLGRAFARLDRYRNTGGYRITPQDIEKCVGAPWSALTPEEKKWVVTHPDAYTVLSYNDVWGRDSAKIHKIGDSASFKTRSYHSNEALYVSDDVVDAERARRIYENRFEHIRNHSLAWGLQKQEVVSEDEAKLFDQGSGADPFRDSKLLFGINPEEWEGDIVRVKQAARDRIAEDFKRLNALEQAELMIAQRGGWKKFLEQYDQDVKVVVDKGTDEEE